MISYRRDDSMDITGRIFDRLTSRYGRGAVYRDIDSIPPGSDFREHLQTALGDSDALMVVVGPRWRSEDRQGKARILSETDYVRTEVEIALNRQIPVIPLLVGGSEMPEPGELPDSIRSFAYRNAVTIDSGRDFDHHMNGLIRALDDVLHGLAPPPPGTVEARAVQDNHRGRPLESVDRSSAVPPAAAGHGHLVLQILGGAMLAQGIVHVIWFSLNVINAMDTGATGQTFRDIWMYADMIFGFGGLVVGIGTLYGHTWGRVSGITLCLLMSFGNLLWFVDQFDQDVSRLVFAATGVGLILGSVALYFYAFRWPAADSP